MKKTFFLLFLLLLPLAISAQIELKGRPINKKAAAINDSLNRDRSRNKKSIKNLEAKIEDYKIISFKNDTTYVDTTLTIFKEYKYNYLRKDNFNLISFSNIGQTYNTLSEDFASTAIMPKFAAQSKHFNYMDVEDIDYYYVPTPLTELMYKTAFEQGQLLDAFFTTNTSKQFNFSIAYKGLRSLGKYQNLLTSTGNFRFTTNYKTKDNTYQVKSHVVMQDVLNHENGGLKDEEIVFFETGEQEHLDRSIFDMNFQNAEGTLKGKRFYLDQNYALIQQKDSLSENLLKFNNILSFEDKYYDYSQTKPSTGYFGAAFVSDNSRVFNKVKLEEFTAQLGMLYKNNIIGQFGFALNYTDYNYGYNSIVLLQDARIINRIKGNTLGFKADYTKHIKKFELYGELGAIISGNFTGNYLLANMQYQFNKDNKLKLQVNSNTKEPNYNYQLFQSDYINYNWQTNFKTTKTNQVSAQFQSEKLLNISLDFSTIDGFTYFNNTQTNPEEPKEIKPYQNNSTISYLRVKANREFKIGKFALNNTVMFQEVSDDEQSFNVPQIITRNTLYYSNHFFKRALYLQSGVTLNYFTEYYMNAYDPVLSEFYTQTNQKFGNYPRLDFFINAKVRQTRIFIKAEHFNSAWTGYDYYSAPNYPYRDFTVRFGLVWNFFL